MWTTWGGKGALIQDDMSATLSTSNVQTIFYAIQGDIARGAHMGQNGKGWSDDGSSYTLNTIDQHATAYALQGNMIGRSDNAGPSGRGVNEDVSFTLNTTDKHAVVYCMADANAKAAIDNDMCGTLKVGGEPPLIANQYVVRRLMPIECERLQGFPDGWTDIEFKGKPASDTARYKALGNSMAVPVMKWIGERIEAADRC